MKDKNIIKKIMIALLVVILLIAAYATFNELTNSDNEKISSSSLSSLVGLNQVGQIQETEVVIENAEILRVLGSIQSIKLNDNIFSNPVFLELKDSRFTIPKPSLIGRANPFRPIGVEKLDLLRTQTQSSQNSVEEGPSVDDFFGGINS